VHFPIVVEIEFEDGRFDCFDAVGPHALDQVAGPTEQEKVFEAFLKSLNDASIEDIPARGFLAHSVAWFSR
jgi:hypothetical protein